MNTVFQIKASEFNENLFDQLKTFVSGRTNAEIIISINEPALKATESERELLSRLNLSIEEINRGEGILFTMSELEKFVKE